MMGFLLGCVFGASIAEKGIDRSQDGFEAITIILWCVLVPFARR